MSSASGGGEGYAVRDGDASSFSFQETKRLFELTGGQSTGGPGRRFQVPHLQKGPQREHIPGARLRGVLCGKERRTTMTKQDVLKQYFGYDTFRGGQEEIIDALLAGRDVLAVMPTGAGEIGVLSGACPAAARHHPGGLPAGLPHEGPGDPAGADGECPPPTSTALSPTGSICWPWTGPGRAGTRSSMWLRSGWIPRGSSPLSARPRSPWWQWTRPTVSPSGGQDFRPAYLNIPDFVDRLPQRPVVGAFTATATSEVREDIQRLLELEAPCPSPPGLTGTTCIWRCATPP